MFEFQANYTDGAFSASELNKEYVNTVLPLSISFGILCAVGIFGNSFIVYVYIRKYPQCNFRYFVIILGIIDLVRCVLTIPAEIHTQYTWFVKPISEICKIKIFFNTVSITCSSVILLFIAVDRYRKACCPHGRQIKPTFALKVSLALCIVSLVWSSPALVFCGPQTFVMKHAGTNLSVTICLKDDSFKNTIWPFLLLKAFYAIPTIIIMTVTLVLYIFIARSIYKRTAKRTKCRTATTNTNYRPSVEMIENSKADFSEIADEHSCVDLDSTDTLQNTPNTLAANGNVNPSVATGRKAQGTYEHNSPPLAAGRKPQPIYENVSPSGAFYIKTGTMSSAFLFDMPLVDLKTEKEADKRPRSTLYSRASRRRQRSRMRRNTLIMFILTLFYVISILVYFVLAFQMADTSKFFSKLAVWEGVIVMFFLRLYYFNSLINAIIYGLLDPRFRRSLRRASRRISRSVASIAQIRHRN